MREVVTAILKNEDKILIVKRGKRVNTFRGKWSGISGRMESTPLESIKREVEEETGIPAEKATLIREGNPILAEGEGLEFKVYPFLYEVADKKITLNWENTEYRWIKPHEIKRYRTVPQLIDVIEEMLKE